MINFYIDVLARLNSEQDSKTHDVVSLLIPTTKIFSEEIDPWGIFIFFVALFLVMELHLKQQ